MAWGRHSLRNLTFLLVSIVASTALLDAQVEVPSSSGRVAGAARVERSPRLDGTLEDPIWQSAPLADDFRQREPLETAPPRKKPKFAYSTTPAIFTSASAVMTWPPPRLLLRSCVEIYPWIWTITLPS